MEPIDGPITVAILVLYLTTTLGLMIILKELLRNLKNNNNGK